MYLAAGKGGSGLSWIILIVVLGGVYLLFIRSIQRKQRNQASSQQQMRNSLDVGAEIVTIGGLYGTVVDVDDDSVMLEISEGVTARYDRNAIARVITPAEDSADESADDDDSDDHSADDHSVDADAEADHSGVDATANSVIEKKD